MNNSNIKDGLLREIDALIQETLKESKENIDTVPILIKLRFVISQQDDVADSDVSLSKSIISSVRNGNFKKSDLQSLEVIYLYTTSMIIESFSKLENLDKLEKSKEEVENYKNHVMKRMRVYATKLENSRVAVKEFLEESEKDIYALTARKVTAEEKMNKEINDVTTLSKDFKSLISKKSADAMGDRFATYAEQYRHRSWFFYGIGIAASLGFLLSVVLGFVPQSEDNLQIAFHIILSTILGGIGSFFFKKGSDLQKESIISDRNQLLFSSVIPFTQNLETFASNPERNTIIKEMSERVFVEGKLENSGEANTNENNFEGKVLNLDKLVKIIIDAFQNKK